jgi:hypothetical protein
MMSDRTERQVTSEAADEATGTRTLSGIHLWRCWASTSFSISFLGKTARQALLSQAAPSAHSPGLLCLVRKPGLTGRRQSDAVSKVATNQCPGNTPGSGR